MGGDGLFMFLMMEDDGRMGPFLKRAKDTRPCGQPLVLCIGGIQEG